MPWAGPHNEEDKAMVKLYTTMFANFIRDGNPSIEGKSWTPYSPSQGIYMNINSPSDVELSRCLPLPEDRLNFWQDILQIRSKIAQDFEPWCPAESRGRKNQDPSDSCVVHANYDADSQDCHSSN